MSPERETDPREWIRSAVQRYERPLVSYAERLVGEPEGARDVVQETFLRLCQQDRSLVDGHLAEWLFKVTRNRALDVRTKEQRMTPLTEQDSQRPGPAAEPGARLEAEEAQSRLLRSLSRLPEKQREALRLKFQHGLSYKEIARVTEQSVGNVGWLIHTGLKGLRARLGTDELEATS